MPDYHVTEELQTYLVGQGVGQLPGETPSLVLPSIWLQPRDGAPLPRRGGASNDFLENATITLNDTLLAAPAALEAWIEEAFIDIVVRARQNAQAKLIHRQILGLLHPITAHGGRKMWAMASIDPVEYSTIWRGEQPLPQRQAIAEGDPHYTYDRVASYRFGVRRKVLAGLAYVP